MATGEGPESLQVTGLINLSLPKDISDIEGSSKFQPWKLQLGWLEVCILHARHSRGNPQPLQHWGLVGCLPVCRDSPSAETSQQIGCLANLGDIGSKRFSMDLSQQTPTMQPVERSNLRNGKTDTMDGLMQFHQPKGRFQQQKICACQFPPQAWLPTLDLPRLRQWTGIELEP